MGDTGSDVTIFLAYVIRETKKHGTNVIETELSLPYPIEGFVKDTNLLSHDKVSFPNTSLQTEAIPEILFQSVEGYVFPNISEIFIDQYFCSKIDFDFGRFLEE